MKSTRARSQSAKENKKNIIIDTAIDIYLRSESAIPLASQIAKESNMTKGNLYTYFKSREDLYYEILSLEYDKWFDYVLSLGDYGHKLDTRLFESFYRNELLVKLNSLYHSTLKHSLAQSKKEELEKNIRTRLDKLSKLISPSSNKTQNEVLILLYSSISLVVGSYQFQSEFHYGFDYISPEDIYLPRLKVMWDIF